MDRRALGRIANALPQGAGQDYRSPTKARATRSLTVPVISLRRTADWSSSEAASLASSGWISCSRA